MTATCEFCRWWDASVQHADAPADTTGLCRVKPPAIDHRTRYGRWPFTFAGDWCAAFSADRRDGD